MLSVVIPVYNEEEVIEELYTRLKKVLESIGEGYEIIFVDDGSFDSSFEIMKQLYEVDKQVKIIKLSRNFGHQIAITAGIDHAQGAAVISMDADLQHPPEIIPKLIEEWKEGYDIVYTIREDTGKADIFKKLPSLLFYKIINRISGTHINVSSPDFRLMDRKVVKNLKSMRERARFIRGLTNWMGFNQIGVKFVARPRYGGKPKYSLRKMISFALDGITSFSSFPLRIASYLGFTVSLISFIYAAYAISMRFFAKHVVPGWTSIIAVVLFLGGIQLITLGIIGEYIGRIYKEVKQRPMYLIDELVGFADERE